jgi:hypothetical protein
MIDDNNIDDDKMEELSEASEDMTALQSFYHIFTLGKHENETDLEYEDRKIARQTFESMLEQNGITPSDYLAELLRRGDHKVH